MQSREQTSSTKNIENKKEKKRERIKSGCAHDFVRRRISTMCICSHARHETSVIFFRRTKRSFRSVLCFMNKNAERAVCAVHRKTSMSQIETSTRGKLITSFNLEINLDRTRRKRNYSENYSSEFCVINVFLYSFQN